MSCFGSKRAISGERRSPLADAAAPVQSNRFGVMGYIVCAPDWCARFGVCCAKWNGMTPVCTMSIGCPQHGQVIVGRGKGSSGCWRSAPQQYLQQGEYTFSVGMQKAEVARTVKALGQNVAQ